MADQNRLFATGKDSIEKSKADGLARDGEEITTLSKFLLKKNEEKPARKELPLFR